MSRREGVVVEFDAHVGLGAIEADGERLMFHCVEIADGRRDVAVGTRVVFDLRWKFARPEAFAVQPLI